jgi:acylglycerol lipase
MRSWLILALLGVIATTGCAPVIQKRGAATVEPGLTLGAVIGTATMPDGAALPVRAWRPAAGETIAAVVALHGFNDYSNAYSDLGPALAARGIAVYAYDQRGFGEAPGRGLWPGTDRMTRDFRVMVDLVRARHPGARIVGLGESMGGAVIMAALADYHRPAIDAAVLSAPAVRGREVIGPALSATLDTIAHVAPGALLRPQNIDITPSDNIEMLRGLARDRLFIKQTRVDALHGLVGLMDRALASTWTLNAVPVLILYGARDDIVPRDAACLMLSRLPGTPRTIAPRAATIRPAPPGASPSWRVALYPEGYHLLFRDLAGDLVTGDIAAFATDPTASLPSGHEAMARMRPRAPSPLPGFCDRRRALDP